MNPGDKLAPGDIVAVDGRAMVVENVHPSGEMAICSWFENGRKRKGRVATEALAGQGVSLDSVNDRSAATVVNAPTAGFTSVGSEFITGSRRVPKAPT